MRLDPYRETLAVAPFRRLMLVALFVRVPATMLGIAFTFYVVQDLGRGYGAAGTVVMASAIGTMVGGPILGRLLDSHGLRVTLGLTAVGEALLWFASPVLPFAALVPFVAVMCVMRLPIFAIARQSIATTVPPECRVQAFALDSMAVELSYMVGPALAAFLSTQYSGRTTLIVIGILMVLSCAALFVVNPPVARTRSAAGPPACERPRAKRTRRHRPPFGRELLVQFAVAAAAMVALAGSDVAVVAVLQAAGQVTWTSVVFVVWCTASLAGGFLFGAIRSTVSPVVLIALFTALTVPIGLASDWRLLCLALIPSGLFIAPSMAASSNAVAGLAPAGAVGEVLGWHGAVSTIGSSLGAPLAGAAIDHTTPAGGFVAVGGVGLAIVCLVVLADRITRRSSSACPQGVVVAPRPADSQLAAAGVGLAKEGEPLGE